MRWGGISSDRFFRSPPLRLPASSACPSLYRGDAITTTMARHAGQVAFQPGTSPRQDQGLYTTAALFVLFVALYFPRDASFSKTNLKRFLVFPFATYRKAS